MAQTYRPERWGPSDPQIQVSDQCIWREERGFGEEVAKCLSPGKPSEPRAGDRGEDTRQGQACWGCRKVNRLPTSQSTQAGDTLWADGQRVSGRQEHPGILLGFIH